MATIVELGRRWPAGGRRAGVLLAAATIAVAPVARSQQTASTTASASVQGIVADAFGKAVPGALVKLHAVNGAGDTTATTDASGHFSIVAPRGGRYTIIAAKAQLRSEPVTADSPAEDAAGIRLVLSAPRQTSGNLNQAVDFSDSANFTVAGVTDWTAVGGHGSDATLRTSEDLARETLLLKPAAGPVAGTGKQNGSAEEFRLRAALAAEPQSYAANRALGEYYLRAARYTQAIPLLQTASRITAGNADAEYDLALACEGAGDDKQAQQHVARALAKQDSARFHRLAGELDEKLGDPLAAVQEQERATRLDPSEENYFAWGSELLLHRAVWQAAEVLKSGAKAHPASARMLTAWGTALFAGALYAEAAQRVCEASDLNPADPEAYLFLGRIEAAAPAPLPCVQEKLARFLQLQPENATANYLHAMLLLKRGGNMSGVEIFLEKAVALDPKYSDAFLQLGITAFAKHDYLRAIDYYKRAIAADRQMGEAHYRLGIAYDRTGDHAGAARELALHDSLEKVQADTIEQQRRQVKQFLIVLQRQPASATPD